MGTRAVGSPLQREEASPLRLVLGHGTGSLAKEKVRPLQRRNRVLAQARHGLGRCGGTAPPSPNCPSPRSGKPLLLPGLVGF